MAGSPRQKNRFPLRLPVQVLGTDAWGDRFAESAWTVNVSGGGVCLDLRRHVAIGSRLELSIELPFAIRHRFGGRSRYDVRAVTCRVERTAEGNRVGARFLGVLRG